MDLERRNPALQGYVFDLLVTKLNDVGTGERELRGFSWLTTIDKEGKYSTIPSFIPLQTGLYGAPHLLMPRIGGTLDSAFIINQLICLMSAAYLTPKYVRNIHSSSPLRFHRKSKV